MNYIFLAAGITGLVVTVYLSVVGEKTLSQRAQALAPRWLDWIIGVGVVGIFCFLQEWYLHLNIWLFAYWCMFWGHIWIANKERYGD
jgi:hypothetical protein